MFQLADLRRLALTVTLVAALAAGCTRTASSPEESPAEATPEPAETATETAADTTGAEPAAATKAPTGRLSPDDPALAAPADVAAAPADAGKSDSGLAWKILRPGTGEAHPTLADQVTVHYTGWTTDGNRFDSSLERGAPATFPLRGVIAGWTEALQLMVVGEKRRVWIPANLAYEGRSGPQGTLVFDIDLLEIKSPPKPPEDLSGPPAGASRTRNGVAYRALEEGDGTDHPTERSIVTVHYDIWSADGRLFQSTNLRSRPRTTDIRAFVPGMQEALQLMVPGDSWRLWIPQDQAFQGRARAPEGTLVVDVKLLDVIAQPVPGKGSAPR